jgi:hypothetical protein
MLRTLIHVTSPISKHGQQAGPLTPELATATPERLRQPILPGSYIPLLRYEPTRSPMQQLSNIYDYMRLCAAPHKRIYVLKSVMLSWPTEAPHLLGFLDVQHHIKTGFHHRSFANCDLFRFAAIWKKRILRCRDYGIKGQEEQELALLKLDPRGGRCRIDDSQKPRPHGNTLTR